MPDKTKTARRQKGIKTLVYDNDEAKARIIERAHHNRKCYDEIKDATATSQKPRANEWLP